jgi:hypothetical protein
MPRNPNAKDYRFFVQNHVFELADEVLRPGGFSTSWTSLVVNDESPSARTYAGAAPEGVGLVSFADRPVNGWALVSAVARKPG